MHGNGTMAKAPSRMADVNRMLEAETERLQLAARQIKMHSPKGTHVAGGNSAIAEPVQFFHRLSSPPTPLTIRPADSFGELSRSHREAQDTMKRLQAELGHAEASLQQVQADGAGAHLQAIEAKSAQRELEQYYETDMRQIRSEHKSRENVLRDACERLRCAGLADREKWDKEEQSFRHKLEQMRKEKDFDNDRKREIESDIVNCKASMERFRSERDVDREVICALRKDREGLTAQINALQFEVSEARAAHQKEKGTIDRVERSGKAMAEEKLRLHADRWRLRDAHRQAEQEVQAETQACQAAKKDRDRALEELEEARSQLNPAQLGVASEESVANRMYECAEEGFHGFFTKLETFVGTERSMDDTEVRLRDALQEVYAQERFHASELKLESHAFERERNWWQNDRENLKRAEAQEANSYIVMERRCEEVKVELKDVRCELRHVRAAPAAIITEQTQDDLQDDFYPNPCGQPFAALHLKGTSSVYDADPVTSKRGQNLGSNRAPKHPDKELVDSGGWKEDDTRKVRVASCEGRRVDRVAQATSAASGAKRSSFRSSSCQPGSSRCVRLPSGPDAIQTSTTCPPMSFSRLALPQGGAMNNVSVPAHLLRRPKTLGIATRGYARTAGVQNLAEPVRASPPNQRDAVLSIQRTRLQEEFKMLPGHLRDRLLAAVPEQHHDYFKSCRRSSSKDDHLWQNRDYSLAMRLYVVMAEMHELSDTVVKSPAFQRLWRFLEKNAENASGASSDGTRTPSDMVDDAQGHRMI